MGKMRNANTILIERPEEKKPLGRPRRRWKYNIRRSVREIGWKRVVWIYVTQDRGQ
jgi:hypothetical protein